MNQPKHNLVHARSHPTVRINSKRFEQSPYAPRYTTEDTLFGIYCNRLYPISFGEDAIDQYWKLRQKAMIFDVPEKPVEIKGPDAITLLDRVFTRRINNLKVGRAHYAIACTPDGGLQMDGVMIRLAEDHFWYVHANGEFESWLTAFSNGLEVSINDPQSRVLQVQGPRSLEILKALDAEKNIDQFGYFHVGHFNFGGQSVLVSRTGWTGEMGFEVYSNCGSVTDHLALWDTIVEVGRDYDMQNAALEVMGIRRLEAGILDYSTDIDNSMTPFDIGLGKFVDFTKEDFIGHKNLRKVNQKCRLFGLICESGIPTVGCRVIIDKKYVGNIRVGDWSPTLKKGIGYVLFDQTAMIGGCWVGKQLTLVDKEGESHRAEVVSLPFLDAEKKIPRGLA